MTGGAPFFFRPQHCQPIPHYARVALPCPMRLRPGACGCGSAALITSEEETDVITSDYVVTTRDMHCSLEIAELIKPIISKL